MNTNLKALIIGCQNGKRDAQHKLYEHLSPGMYAICLRYTRNKMEAEDCLQEGFIKIFTKIEQYSFKGSFEGWARRIIVNTTIEMFRKKEIINSIEVETLEDKNIVDFNENETAEFSADVLHKLIMELPHQYRIVFSLFVLEEYSHEEIANQLNISIGTSKSNLSRARKWLQNRISELKSNELKKYVSAS